MRKTGIPFIAWLCSAAGIAHLAWAPPAQAQLDSTWTVTVNGQSVVVNPDGSFLIPNVAAADLFGSGGPGTLPDQVADEFLRLVGTSMAGGRTRWVASELFQLRSGEAYLVRDLAFGDRPPLLPAWLRLEADRAVIAVGERLALRTTAVLGDGSEVDVTLRGAFTLYDVSRPHVEIDDEGRLTATRVGPVVVTARNSGAVTVRKIDIVAEITPTTLEGFCELPDGAPAQDAEVEANTGARGFTDIRGFFRFQVAVQRGVPLEVLIRLEVGGVLHAARSGPLEVWSGGTTDAGILVLRPASVRLFPNPEFRAETGILRQIGAGDLDSDGLLDVVAAGGSGTPMTVSLLRGSPGRLLAPAEPHRLGTGFLNTFALADLEQDGDLDVLTGTASPGFVVPLLNDGTGGLEALEGFSAGSFPSSIVAGDLNGDGDLDLVLADRGEGVVRVFLGRPGPAFSAPVSYAASAQPGDLALADLDGDRDLDIAEIDGRLGGFISEEAVSLLTNRGDGTFAPRTTRPLPLRPWSIAAEDLDGDGDQDLAVGGLGTPASLVLLFNSGTGAFPGERTFNFAGTVDVAPGDLDGDAVQDLVLGNGTSREELLLLRGTGGGEFLRAGILPASRFPVSGLVRDLDGDAFADIVFGSEIGQVLVFPNLGEGRFKADVLHAVGRDPQALIGADLDQDGDEDLVTANAGFGADSSDLTLLLNAGDASFPSPIALGEHIGANDVAAADLDGDRDLDLAYVLSRTSEARFLLNDGAAGFTPAPAIAAGPSPLVVALGDLDGDGLPELMVANASGCEVRVHENQAGSFGAPKSYALGCIPRQVRLVDTDVDGDLDLVVAAGLKLVFLGNMGNGDLLPAGEYTPGLPDFIHDMAEADVDGDGVLDLGLAIDREGIALLHGQGDGGFARERRLQGAGDRGVVLADLDGEGSVDVIAASWRLGCVAFRAGGKAMHLDERLFGVGQAPVRLVARDLDGDGRLDVAAANQGLGNVSVLLQEP